MKYIFINSIYDIDTRKIAIGQIGQKYIDKEGHRYTTRFNLFSREIEVVRLAATMEEALRVRDKVLRDKHMVYETIEIDDSSNGHSNSNPSPWDTGTVEKSEPIALTSPVIPPEDSGSYQTNDENGETGSEDGELVQEPARPQVFQGDPLAEYDPYHDDFNFVAPDETSYSPTVSMSKKIGEAFYENRFIEETAKELEKMEDRLHAIINSIKKTKFYELNENSDYFEFIRRMDTEARKMALGTLNLYKEIHFYPRHLSYYLARISDENKQIIDETGDDQQKMEKIKRWELQDSFLNTYEVIFENAKVALTALNSVIDTGMADIPAAQQTSIRNAATSCELLQSDCGERLETIRYWKKTHP